jgi:SSS family solute:Na+ symporter
VIIGGLYWRRGTAAGAWAAMLTGSVLAVAGILLRNIIWPSLLPRWRQATPDWRLWEWLPENFPFNGMQMSFFAACIAVLAYVVCSLLSKSPPANMEKLLHRGQYSITCDQAATTVIQKAAKTGKTLWTRLGVGPEFTRGDKAIYLFKMGWVLFFFTSFIIGTIANAFYAFPDSMWEKWWGFIVILTFVIGLGTIVWFLWGGCHDLVKMVNILRITVRNASDDGTVSKEEHVQEKKTS